MTPVWALRGKLPVELTEKLQTYLQGPTPCWPELNRGPTKSALAIAKLRRNMRLTLKEVQEQYSPTGPEGEDFHFAWMEHKRDLIWDRVAEGRYPGSGCPGGCAGCRRFGPIVSNFLL